MIVALDTKRCGELWASLQSPVEEFFKEVSGPWTRTWRKYNQWSHQLIRLVWLVGILCWRQGLCNNNTPQGRIPPSKIFNGSLSSKLHRNNLLPTCALVASAIKTQIKVRAATWVNPEKKTLSLNNPHGTPVLQFLNWTGEPQQFLDQRLRQPLRLLRRYIQQAWLSSVEYWNIFNFHSDAMLVC